jgi:hypothetical protein
MKKREKGKGKREKGKGKREKAEESKIQSRKSKIQNPNPPTPNPQPLIPLLRLFHSKRHFLPIAQFQDVSVGIGEKCPVANGMSSVSGSFFQVSFRAGLLTAAIDFFPALASNSQVCRGQEAVLNFGFLEQNNDKRAGLVANPGNVIAIRFGAAVHHVHVGVSFIKGKASIHVAYGQSNVGQS